MKVDVALELSVWRDVRDGLAITAEALRHQIRNMRRSADVSDVVVRDIAAQRRRYSSALRELRKEIEKAENAG